MNNSNTEQSTSTTPTMTSTNFFQQFPTSNFNSSVLNVFQQFLPKNNISTLFTIEQLELIRRLKMTGISADAVLEAFQTLEKIETNFGGNNVQSLALAALMGTSPKLFAEQQMNDVLTIQNLPQILPLQNSVINQSPNLLQHLTSQTFSNSMISQIPNSLSKIETSKTPPNLSPENRTITTVPFSSTTTCIDGRFFPVSNLNTNFTVSPSATTSANSSSNNSACRPIRSQRTPMKEITTLDDPAELDEFMSQGEEGCINDMKQFITQFSLRQTTVAMMTGVSQPYISKLLNGNHRELSLRCRKNIYSWYLNCRRHPEKLAFFLQDPSTRLETDINGDLIPQRRERYVFRPILIKILENYFSEIPFPDYSKRTEIAAVCNKALQMDKKGAGLMPKEIVSAQVVANWFANKRKEMRRKSNEDSLISNGTNLPSPQMDRILTLSPIDGENNSIELIENLNNLKNIFNLNQLYVKKNSETEFVSESMTPPSSAELDKLPSNLLSSLLAAYQQPNPGLNFVKIEQTAE